MKSKTDINTLLGVFDGINYSNNYEKDFSTCTLSRNMKEYDRILKWCKIFLFNKSFTAFSGDNIAYSLLFPMEKLFESYIAAKLFSKNDKSRYTLKTQDKSHYLFDYPSKKFFLKPDIVICNANNKATVVLDTKWKMLSKNYHNYGISQSDMYQMYAYDKKYESEKVVLLYPFNHNVDNLSEISFKSNDNVNVKVLFIDLSNINQSIDAVINEINN